MARESLMSVDYEQLKSFVKEAMFTKGGINEPSAPEGVPHRMPAAEPSPERGDPKANKLYDLALAAREATEALVEALDEPIYDGAYEHAFRADASLRRALNSLEESGAHPAHQQRVVPPPPKQQKYANSHNYMPVTYSAGELEEQEDAFKGFGSRQMSQSAQSMEKKKIGAQIGAGDILKGVDNKERAMLQHVEKILTDIAEKDDLTAYRSWLKTVFANLVKKVEGRLSGQEPEQETTP